MKNQMQIIINAMTTKAINKAALVYKTLKSSSDNTPCNQSCAKCGNSDIHRHYHKSGDEICWDTGFSTRLSTEEKQELLQHYPDFVFTSSSVGCDFKLRQEAIKHCCRVCQHKWLSKVVTAE